MTWWLAAALPWLLVLLYGALVVRVPPPLPRNGASGPPRDGDPPDAEIGDGEDGDEGRPPLVSIIVPARNEAETIGTCLQHLTASTYPRFEILVVDDRSDDGTGERAREHAPGNAHRLEVVDGEPLPEGWLGKPWACRQGYDEARGELLLFTDADTRHAPDLLQRSVGALLGSGGALLDTGGAERPSEGSHDPAGALTLMGRQLMETFWEKVIQPQVMVLLAFRFPRLGRELRPDQWRDTVANGQYILFRRETYEAIGGHDSVKGEVAEDLRLAQILCVRGHRMLLREAEDGLATRMYRSFDHIVEGWSKNMAVGARQALPPGAHRWVFPLAVALGVGLWLAPPVVALFAIAVAAAPGLPPWGWWAIGVTGVSAAFWMAAAVRSRIHPGWGLLYPVGAAASLLIFLRSWSRGDAVEWKGRRYRINPDLLP